MQWCIAIGNTCRSTPASLELPWTKGPESITSYPRQYIKGPRPGGRGCVESAPWKVNAIEELAEAVRRLIGPKSLIESKVLFSGAHAGDVIELDSIRQLSNELEQVRRTANVRHESVPSEFVRSMEDLVNVALAEGNPIVFT